MVAAADPADAVCARSASGSVVSDPPSVSSEDGVLEVTFQYETTTDEQGLTRYCYLYKNAAGQVEEAPTLEVNPGDQLILHFYNDLPAASAEATAAGAMPGMKMKAAATSADSACSATSVTSESTNLHFHGTNIAPVCHQDEVVHTLVQPQESFDYDITIPANEPPGAYWYHPHPHGYSQGQVIGGASGVILVGGIQNVNPVVSGLPQRVFVLRDQKIPSSVPSASNKPATDLSINYVPVLYSAGYKPAVIDTAPSEKEFWRVLNTSANTLMDLEVVNGAGVGQPLQIVAVDGVPLTDSSGNATTTTQTSYVLSPASRVEFVVTTPAAGATYQLKTLTWNNGSSGDADPGRPIANIVGGSAEAASAAVRAPLKRLPAQTAARRLTRFAALSATTPTTTRNLYFSVASDFSAFYITVDGQTPTPFSMDGPPNITVTEGTTEQWIIQNRSTMDHSFHIHQLHFETLAINGSAVSDSTRRDTINIPHWSGNASDPYPSVTLLMDFRDPNIVGTFVYHCHILSHEDLGMMGMIQVLPGVTTTTLAASSATVAAGASVTLTAAVTTAAGNGTPTGTVTFQSGSTRLGSATLNGSGVAALSTTALPPGSNSVTASYTGSTPFAASTSAASAITVTGSAAAAPVFSPSGGPSGPGRLVAISTATAGAAIYYTTNGTAPTTSSTPYRGAITVSSTETVQAMAVASGYANSAVASATYTLVPGGPSSALQYVPVTPCRVADTRNAVGAFGGPEMSAGQTREFDIPTSACNIPATAVAYSLNVTVIPDAALNYLTLWPSGQTQPIVSTLNSDGRVKANAAITPAGSNGGVDVFTYDATQVILDIDGYFVPAGTASALSFYPVTPCRIADTRNATGPLGAPYVAAGSTRNIPVLSAACGIPGGAQAYSVNVTAIPHTALNYLTSWPAGQAQPLVSTLNATTGEVTANAAIVPAGSGGNISFFASDDIDLVLDVNGYFAAPASGGLSLYTLLPCRVLDTRSSSGAFNGLLAVAVGASACAPPGTAQGYVLNATVLPPGPLNYLTLWPDGQTQPVVSTLNAADGAITSNMAIVPTTDESIDAFSYNPTQLILDLSSYFAP